MLTTKFINLSRFQTDPEFRSDAKMIMALAFLPPHKVVEGSNALTAYLPQELNDVLQWFKQYYIES